MVEWWPFLCHKDCAKFSKIALKCLELEEVTHIHRRKT